jgi:hypothetical protein
MLEREEECEGLPPVVGVCLEDVDGKNEMRVET